MDISSLSLASKPSNYNGRIPWPEAHAEKQYFSLPDSLIYYITKNPSTSKCYSKMIQSCKYFFEKNPILVVKLIHGLGKFFCSENYNYCYGDRKCCAKIDITEISSKIWPTSQFNLFSKGIEKFAPLFCSKIYRCEEAQLYAAYLTIDMKDFRIFASKFQKFLMHDISIIENDGSIVMLDKIIESISTVKEFEYEYNRQVPSATATTMKNINKLTNLGILRKIELHCIPEVFNVEDLEEFIKNHKSTKIRLLFRSNISEQYKNHLDKLIDIVIASNAPKHYILYHRQNQEKSKIMYDRYYG